MKSITQNPADPRDAQSMPSRIEEGGGEDNTTTGPYRGHNTQLSEPGNDSVAHSGLPHLSDGTPRHNSRASSPLADKPKVHRSTKPVNP